MPFGNLVRLGVLSVLCAIGLVLGVVVDAPVARGASTYQLHPIELVGYEGKALRVGVEMPCGGELYGFVARVDAKTKTLRLAAAVRQPTIACTSMPEPVELVVDWFDTTGFKVITPMKLSGVRRMSVVRLTDLGVVEKKGDSSKQLRAVYESRCGDYLGALVRPSGVGTLQVAMVERPASGEPVSCRSKAQERMISALDPSLIGAKYKVAALRERAGPLSKAYYLRLAEVRPESVVAAEGGIALSYKRACNEAPVGIVLRSATSGIPAMSVGMLVAHYYNRACAKDEVAETWSEAREMDLRLAKGAKPTLMAATSDMDSLKLTRPVEVAKVRRPSGAEELSITYMRSCAKAPLGAVYARDARGKLAVGVLESGVASPCKSRPAEVSWYQPFIAQRVSAQDMHPLRLSGAPSA